MYRLYGPRSAHAQYRKKFFCYRNGSAHKKFGSCIVADCKLSILLILHANSKSFAQPCLNKSLSLLIRAFGVALLFVTVNSFKQSLNHLSLPLHLSYIAISRPYRLSEFYPYIYRASLMSQHLYKSTQRHMHLYSVVDSSRIAGLPSSHVLALHKKATDINL